jgi:hypothetical protein
MSQLLRLVFFIAWRLKVVALSMAAGAAIASGLHVRRDARSWGRLPGDAERALPGDDLVADAELVETRSLLIAAPPSRVWPWIVQLGYGRGGWYGFAPLDRPWRPGGAPGQSAEVILPEFQRLAVGDLVPTHPGGGFVVKVLEPQRSLVLYLDDQLVREQAATAATARTRRPDGGDAADMPPFRAAWAFVLTAEPGGSTRLTERVRLDIDVSAAQRRGMPMLGMALFTLLRSQMEGLRRRAEGPAGG